MYNSLTNILDKNSMVINHRSAHCKKQYGDQEEDVQNLTSTN